MATPVRVRRLAAQVTAHAVPRRPMKIIDSRFEKGRCARSICCDNCHDWYHGNAVGTFWHTQNMPAPACRRAAWERGHWDATWYCKKCCAEYWHCSKEQVMDYLGFSKSESGNHHFMNARKVSASIGCPQPPVVPPPFHVKKIIFF